MKITSSKTFLMWCDQAPKICERIDFDNLPDHQKDQAVIAYCMDFDSRHMKAMALHLQSPTCADNVKESAFRNTEYDIRYLVTQYNDMLDLRDAERIELIDDHTWISMLDPDYKYRHFNARFNQAEIDAGFSGTGREF